MINIENKTGGQTTTSLPATVLQMMVEPTTPKDNRPIGE
jgi:hypothetical protein